MIVARRLLPGAGNMARGLGRRLESYRLPTQGKDLTYTGHPEPQTKTASSRGPAQTERLHTDRWFFICACRCTAARLCARLAALGRLWFASCPPPDPERRLPAINKIMSVPHNVHRECNKRRQCVITRM
ncbi:hypothetical protein RR46_09367 [Papilio xuthus]|uniref:Uncharacterized protein n=1 Tax=Papilio xuthus TaxID=66420 RepID=A0A194Q226_PAPXU|nr:hypothetical protein RR46_09367 [Papilio xuthus]